MKRTVKNLCTPAIGLIAFAAALSFGGPGVRAAFAHPQTPIAPQARQQNSPAETFTGEVNYNPDSSRDRLSSYVLYDSVRKTNFFLGDRDFDSKLDRYVGQMVRVTGTLDEPDHLIRIASIKAVS